MGESARSVVPSSRNLYSASIPEICFLDYQCEIRLLRTIRLALQTEENYRTVPTEKRGEYQPGATVVSSSFPSGSASGSSTARHPKLEVYFVTYEEDIIQ